MKIKFNINKFFPKTEEKSFIPDHFNEKLVCYSTIRSVLWDLQCLSDIIRRDSVKDISLAARFVSKTACFNIENLEAYHNYAVKYIKRKDVAEFFLAYKEFLIQYNRVGIFLTQINGIKSYIESKGDFEDKNVYEKGLKELNEIKELETKNAVNAFYNLLTASKSLKDIERDPDYFNILGIEKLFYIRK